MKHSLLADMNHCKRLVGSLTTMVRQPSFSRCLLFSVFTGADLTALMSKFQHGLKVQESVSAAVDNLTVFVNTGKPLCSNEVFRAYYRVQHAFPPPGQWTVSDPNVSVVFSPDICSFPDDITSKDFLKKCFQRKRIRSVLIMGDYQGTHYGWGLWNIFNQTFDACELLKQETIKWKHDVDIRYFSDGNFFSRITNDKGRTLVQGLPFFQNAMPGQ